MPEFDYIVAGAGSAGCVLAARLAARPGTRVALIEAGKRLRSPWLRIPLGFGRLVRNERVLWPYRTAPEPALGGRQVAFPRGKLLGGSGSINGLVFLRGAPSDYDAWEVAGATGWSYRDVLPWFRKLEHHLVAGADPEFHGEDGPVSVSQITPSPAARAFVAAAMEAGYPRNDDFNGASPYGVGFAPANVKGGQRISPADAYLLPTLKSGADITLFLSTTVERLEIADKRVTGVLVRRPDGSTMELSARRETILATGVVNTPQILMLSGIGPAAHLSDFGIPVVQHLPVGEGLQDHALARLSFRSRNVVTLNRVVANPLRGSMAGLQYLLRRSGPLSVAASEAVLMADLPGSVKKHAGPDVLIQFANFLIENYQRGLGPEDGFVYSVCLCRPESRGRVLLGGHSIADAPIIEANYFGVEEDMERTVAGLRLLENLAHQPSLARIIERRVLPVQMESDDDLRAHIRETATTVFHPCGTCPIGTDSKAVVTPDLRLRGFEGLRIADASVMPSVPSTNIHAATIMIAERAANMIQAGSALASSGLVIGAA
ncbi:GMC family oxidoreductase [Mesorhizobium sp. 1B3]|uniref:GMC family oxidoreductase n=1 Tax=Mesorhizobium sp. 1B3 TaxID=3243599 RepID=UPI003D99F132